MNRRVIPVNGVNDAKHYSQITERSWTFRTVGYGHGAQMWKELISALLAIGYDGAINVEHEDIVFSRARRPAKGLRFPLRPSAREPPEAMWWA